MSVGEATMSIWQDTSSQRLEWKLRYEGVGEDSIGLWREISMCECPKHGLQLVSSGASPGTLPVIDSNIRLHYIVYFPVG